MSLLPSNQYKFDDLPSLSEEELYRRRETVFLILSGIFLGTLAMLNILGISKFINMSFELPFLNLKVPMPIAVGALPYPITFLCTDFISELFGKERANKVVYVGFLVNLWVVFVIWLGDILPGFPSPVYDKMKDLAFGAVTASMIAYLVAQVVDIRVFHFWKNLTKGRYLWIRNNGSTLLSQLVDTTAVVIITHFLANSLPVIPEKSLWPQLFSFTVAGYIFKLSMALIDTLPFYLGAQKLSRYLRIKPAHLHDQRS